MTPPPPPLSLSLSHAYDTCKGCVCNTRRQLRWGEGVISSHEHRWQSLTLHNRQSLTLRYHWQLISNVTQHCHWLQSVTLHNVSLAEWSSLYQYLWWATSIHNNVGRHEHREPRFKPAKSVCVPAASVASCRYVRLYPWISLTNTCTHTHTHTRPRGRRATFWSYFLPCNLF